MYNKKNIFRTKVLIKKFFKKLWSGVLFWIWVTLGIWVISLVYATWTSLPTQTSGSHLTSTIWNDLVNWVNDIWKRTDNIYSTGGNIGIWVPNPSTKLDVNWQIKIAWWSPWVGKVLTSDANWLASWQAAVSWKVLQVGYAAKGDSWSATTTWNNFYNVPWLSTTITPASSTNKVLLTISLYGWVTNYQIKFRILRNGVPIILGAWEGGRPTTTGMVIPYDDNWTTQWYQVAFLGWTYMDTPSTTSPTTYQIQMAAYAGQTVFLNRSYIWQNNPASWYDATPVSSMTVMEIDN